MNAITRIKLDKYCKMVNEIDPQYKLTITSDNESYYLHMDSDYTNNRLAPKYWFSSSQYLIRSNTKITTFLKDVLRKCTIDSNYYG
jgi:hypothetical protein